MKQPIALRIEANLLEQVRQCAARENRTMTNFIETVLMREVERSACSGHPVPHGLPATPGSGPAARAGRPRLQVRLIPLAPRLPRTEGT